MSTTTVTIAEDSGRGIQLDFSRGPHARYIGSIVIVPRYESHIDPEGNPISTPRVVSPAQVKMTIEGFRMPSELSDVRAYLALLDAVSCAAQELANLMEKTGYEATCARVRILRDTDRLNLFVLTNLSTLIGQGLI